MAAKPILRTTDGRTVRVEMPAGPWTWTPDEAVEIAAEVSRAAARARRLPADHRDRHINLIASCVLCRFEANEEPDRLDWTR